MTVDAVQPFILSLLGRKGRFPPGFDESTDFISAGIVDSIGIIKFVLELESQFGIEIDASDMECREFRTVRGLTGLIQRKGIP